ncbi:hypothetical protein U9M48_042502 [Paspalum notatum var. saurae]|uniref:Uncharacterized protein n=1 Tax=Paspalum notatum var. saurae TaxID=547442 RepID=A0AAQ3UUX9_PASNO
MALVIGDGGDFNITCCPQEKNNANYFNSQLKEIELTGCQLTWVNNREVQTFEKMDRILVCTDWELKFP